MRRPMKPNLHPELHEVLVHCACGETWTTRSTKKELRIEICSTTDSCAFAAGAMLQRATVSAKATLAD